MSSFRLLNTILLKIMKAQNAYLQVICVYFSNYLVANVLQLTSLISKSLSKWREKASLQILCLASLFVEASLGAILKQRH